MRPGQSNKRSRGRGGRKGPSPLSRSYESNGPDVKIRGTAQHIADKYINLARDAQSSGDSVLSEAYFQHAEHFYRIVATAQQQMNQPVNVKRADDPIETEETNPENGNFDPSDPDAPQPQMNGNGRDRDGDRRSFDDDGERRPRRNRGRSRRGRDDDRQDARAANGGAQPEDNRDSGEGAPQAAPDENREPTAAVADGDAPQAEVAQAESVSGDEQKADAADTTEKPTRTRRAPRSRKATVDVTDRSEGGDEVPAAPKPVTLGDDVAPVQAASEES